ncbi:FMN-dependent NADH-azoreductase [Gryllotalpicola protaetiae]|uniref:FMN dependent NADH:quinone oxidoreductase n=1 Tax=Gryllotalpicola protaetiae TaxID=2419771 RepID=A0A387BKG1_9MICO|nr:NAD(P)H-dependent oxidoreductase [Gryllotalpicola protaetiae]AYG04363.1 flavodoxin family protein [Gryllotalpicola protaetiae]
MSTVFRLDASIKPEGSVTRAVSDTLENAIAAAGDTTVTRREIGLHPLPSDAWATAAFAGYVPADQRNEAQNAAVALATELADELASADVAIIAAPFYNWGVTQHLKTWFDLVLTDGRFSPGAAEKAGEGKTAFLVIARGGGYGEGTPRFGWDHASAWLKRVLEDVWGYDVTVIEAELTLAESTPAMAALVDLARKNLADAHAAAEQHGTAIAGKIAA